MVRGRKVGFKMSQESKDKISRSRIGKYNLEKSSNWKGGKGLSAQGYVRVSLGFQKRELEHRLVMEKHLGRKLRKGEQVHHINGIKTDNRIENLELIDISKHWYKHHRKIEKKCCVCGKKFFSRIKLAKYCGQKCRNKYWKNKLKNKLK